MTTEAQNSTTNWMDAIQAVIAPYSQQVVPYGNLRSETTSWNDESGHVTNMAIVYEVPGGSTNQINITYMESTATFAYLALDTHDEQQTTALAEVLHMVEEAVARIPEIRRNRLYEDIDRWARQGMGQQDLFSEIKKLLQIEDLRGGTITPQEMRESIAYIMANYRAAAS